MKKSKRRGTPIPIKTIITGISIFLQFLLLVLPAIFFSHSAIWFYSICQFLAICFVIIIINRNGNLHYKITWITFILLMPVVGVIVFLLFGGGRALPHLKKRMLNCEKHYKELLSPKEKAYTCLDYNDMFHSRQARYLMNEAHMPVYTGTNVKFLESGEIFFKELLFRLNNAEKYIYIEFFIIAEGFMWDEIHKILLNKISQGVKVKIIFDDFGSIGRQSKGFVANLINEGIEVCAFNPLRPSVDIFMNNRNHRKIVIIDGDTAFTGGINIGDEYINKLNRFGHWQDSGIMIQGEAVKSFNTMFCSMWEFITGYKTPVQELASQTSYSSEGFVAPYCDGPLNDKNPALGLYMQIINNAQRYVYITSPYLILDNNILNALTLASKSGIDVRIIVPHHPDKQYVHPVTQYYYTELLASGVKVYEYTPGFIHSKTFVSDDIVATVGTVNMDYRSFFFHFECGVWISSNSEIKKMKEHFIELTEKSQLITKEAWSKRPLTQKIKQEILHLFSPFM